MSVVVRLFIDTQEQVSAPPLCPVKDHEETDFSPRIVINRLNKVDKTVDRQGMYSPVIRTTELTGSLVRSMGHA